MKNIMIFALALCLCGTFAPVPVHAQDKEDSTKNTPLILNGVDWIYTVADNVEGYRDLTSIEPAAAPIAPVYNGTYYPKSANHGLDIKFRRQIHATTLAHVERVVVLHTTMPLSP